MKKPARSTTPEIDRELDARACEHALWIGLLAAQRAGWPDIVSSLTLVHAAAGDRRRTLEAIGK
jgi:hypothetical protein